VSQARNQLDFERGQSQGYTDWGRRGAMRERESSKHEVEERVTNMNHSHGTEQRTDIDQRFQPVIEKVQQPCKNVEWKCCL